MRTVVCTWTCVAAAFRLRPGASPDCRGTADGFEISDRMSARPSSASASLQSKDQRNRIVRMIKTAAHRKGFCEEPDTAAGQSRHTITNGPGKMLPGFVNTTAISLSSAKFFSGISQQWILISNNLGKIQIFERKTETVRGSDGNFLFDCW